MTAETIRPVSNARQRLRPSLLDRLELWMSTARHVEGLWIGVGGAFVGGRSERALDRAEEALLLIKKHDPRRFDRLVRDLDRLWLRSLPGWDGQYNVALRTCELDIRYVLNEDSTPDLIAATIVHEATHARLMHRDISYHEELRARVEAVCIRRELAFATKLPDGARVCQKARERLAVVRNSSWDDLAFWAREFSGRMQELRDLGVSESVLRAMLTAGVWRLKLSRGFKHPKTAGGLVELGRLLIEQGNLVRAQRCFGRAFEIMEKTLGADHPATAWSMDNLAFVLQARGDLEAARPLFERALASYEKAYGAGDDRTVCCLGNLIAVMQAQSEVTAARDLLTDAAEKIERALGPEHRNTGWSLNELALALQAQGEFARARPLFERASAIYHKALGAEHPDTATVHANLQNLACACRD